MYYLKCYIGTKLIQWDPTYKRGVNRCPSKSAGYPQADKAADEAAAARAASAAPADSRPGPCGRGSRDQPSPADPPAENKGDSDFQASQPKAHVEPERQFKRLKHPMPSNDTIHYGAGGTLIDLILICCLKHFATMCSYRESL